LHRLKAGPEHVDPFEKNSLPCGVTLFHKIHILVVIVGSGETSETLASGPLFTYTLHYSNCIVQVLCFQRAQHLDQ